MKKTVDKAAQALGRSRGGLSTTSHAGGIDEWHGGVLVLTESPCALYDKLAQYVGILRQSYKEPKKLWESVPRSCAVWPAGDDAVIEAKKCASEFFITHNFYELRERPEGQVVDNKKAAATTRLETE